MANAFASKLKQVQDGCRAFLEEMWTESEDGPRVAWWRRFAHFWLLVCKNFVRNRCPVRASALAYTTLLAMIPLLAVAISVTTNLLKKEGEKPVAKMIDQVVATLAPQLNLQFQGEGEQAAAKRKEVVEKITGYIANIQSGTLGATGMVGLVFVAIMLLSTIEATLNDIWGVARGRSWLLRVLNYWAVITLGPLLFALAIGLSTGPYFQVTQDFLMGMPLVGNLLFKVVPFVIPCAGLTLFYKLMPNTKVQWPAAVAGGIFGGVLWQLNNYFSFIYVSSVVTYSKIYGSIAVLPVFLIGLYFSWLILLLGSQIAYAWQNRQVYLQERLAGRINQRGREFIALRLMTHIARQFHTGAPPPTLNGMARCLGVPSRLTVQILGVLQQARLVQELGGVEGGYTPARPLDKITCHEILQALRAGQGEELATREEPARELVRGQFARIEAAERLAADAVTLRDMAERTAALPEVAPQN